MIEKIKLGLAIWITVLVMIYGLITVVIGQYLVNFYHKELEILAISFMFLVLSVFLTVVIYSFLTDPEYWRN